MTAKTGRSSARNMPALAVRVAGTPRNRVSASMVVTPGVSTGSRAAGASPSGAPRSNSARSWLAA